MDEDVERMREALAMIEKRARVALVDWLAAGPSGVHEALSAIADMAEAAQPRRTLRPAKSSRSAA
jgi:hypothetical protein